MRIDATHDMYLPNRRAKRPKQTRWNNAAPRGMDQEEKEEWMRQRQLRKPGNNPKGGRPLKQRCLLNVAPGRPHKDKHENSILGAMVRKHLAALDIQPRPAEPTAQVAPSDVPDTSGVWAI